MEKSYNKHYVLRDPRTLDVKEKNGAPELGELAKADCRLEPRHIKILNKNWRNTGVYYSEVIPEPIFEQNLEQSNAFIDYNSLSKPEILKKCRELGLSTQGTKDDLIERIINNN